MVITGIKVNVYQIILISGVYLGTTLQGVLHIGGVVFGVIIPMIPLYGLIIYHMIIIKDWHWHQAVMLL